MRIDWLAVYDPASGLSRMCTWSGPTRRVVVTGVPISTWANCPLSGFDAPDTAVVHDIAEGASAVDLARQLGGVVLTITQRR